MDKPIQQPAASFVAQPMVSLSLNELSKASNPYDGSGPSTNSPPLQNLIHDPLLGKIRMLVEFVQGAQVTSSNLSLDVWSIAEAKLSENKTHDLLGVCPMSLRYIDCNLPIAKHDNACRFKIHLCPSYARTGKCATDSASCGLGHIRPTCHSHVENKPCKPDLKAEPNHMEAFAHSDTGNWEARVRVEEVRQWMENLGFGNPAALEK